MHRRPTKQPILYILDLLSPLRAFALILAMAFVFIIASLPIRTTPAGLEPVNVDAAGGCKLPGHVGTCSDIVDCCLQWIPASDPGCTNPGPGGGCCVDYGEKCNDPVAPPPSPPSIAGNLSCSQWGSNGWCIDTLNLNLTASDPQGQSIIISGNINGISFACPSGATSCVVPITNDGTGIATYVVRSATGLSASGSINYALDATTPQIDGSLSGVSGSNGWYVSDVTLSASATDAASGLSSFQFSLDSGTWTSYSFPLTLSEGVHTVDLRAVDDAGNQSETSQTFNIDTVTPALDLSVTGTSGSNGWYRSNVQVSATANDAGSGLASIEYSLDAGTWSSYSAPLTITNGAHELSIRAMDAAGNVTQTDQRINVDSTTPTINLSVSGTTGANGWYVSNIQVSASGADSGSGLASFEYSLNDGPWTPYTSVLPYSDGRYSLKFRAIDAAGNSTTTPAQTYSIDTIHPAIALPDSTELGKTVEYGAEDDGSGLSALRVVIEDEDERWPKVAWDEYPSGIKHNNDFLWDGKFKDGTKAPEGIYYLTLKVSDVAGNESRKTANIEVESSLLALILPSFNPPADSPAPTEVPLAPGATGFGGETSNEPDNPQTGSLTAGGQNNTIHADDLAPIAFGAASTSKTNNTDASNILWGATAAAAVGAFIADAAERRRRAEEAARLAKMKESKKGNGSSYRQVAKAYQASLDNLKAMLKQAQKLGMSAVQVSKLKMDVAKSGKIGASLASVRSYFQKEEKNRTPEAVQKQYDNWLQTGKNPPPGYEDVSEAERAAMYMQIRLEAQRKAEAAQKQYEDWLRTGKNPPPGYEDVTEAERAAIYMQTPEVQARLEAQKKWEAEKTYEQFRASDEEEVPKPNMQKTASLASKLEDWLFSQAVQSGVFKWALRNENVRQTILSSTSVVGDSLQSIGDPNRNPRMAAGHEQMWNGIAAWQAIFAMRKDTREYTRQAVTEGRWQDAWRGVVALTKQSLTVQKYTWAAIGITAWNFVTTPIRIFVHDIPEFYHAGKERMDGKDRLWDVLYSSTNLAGDVAGTYAMAKPLGLADRANAGLSKFFFGKEIPNQILPYYIKDTLLNSSSNRPLLNNLVENWNARPSPTMTAAFQFQDTIQKSLSTADNALSSLPAIIQRVYTYGTESYNYTFDPSKPTGLGYSEDVADVSTNDYNVLRGVPEDVYAHTPIQRDLMRDIIESRMKPEFFSDPEDFPRRVFSKYEWKLLDKFERLYGKWYD